MTLYAFLLSPLHEGQGRPIGYAGRLVDDSQVSDKKPKYLFPGAREHERTKYEFHKSEFLYNGHRIQSPADRLTIGEGFVSVWWLHQCGFMDVVAVMGSDCSRSQGAAICALSRATSWLTILTDGDEAGRRCAERIFAEVAPHRLVKWAQLQANRQPTDFKQEELVKLLRL